MQVLVLVPEYQWFCPLRKLERNANDLWVGNFEGVASNVTDNAGFAGEVFRVQSRVLQNLNHFDVVWSCQQSCNAAWQRSVPTDI